LTTNKKCHRVEQLYIVLKDEDKPMVVWKKYGEEPMIFPAEEVEETILTTRPPLGGTKVGTVICCLLLFASFFAVEELTSPCLIGCFSSINAGNH
jgi:hypothetical protein